MNLEPAILLHFFQYLIPLSWRVCPNPLPINGEGERELAASQDALPPCGGGLGWGEVNGYPRSLSSAPLANDILKQAGLPKAF